MDIFKAYETDPKKEIEGVWFPLKDGDGKIKVARSTNPTYTKALLQEFQQFRGATNPDDAEAEKQDKVFVKLLAKYILLDWQNLQDRKGNVFTYSTANAERLLSMRDFRKVVQECSDNFEAFKVEEEEEVGNFSEPVSIGSSSGAAS